MIKIIYEMKKNLALQFSYNPETKFMEVTWKGESNSDVKYDYPISDFFEVADRLKQDFLDNQEAKKQSIEKKSQKAKP